MTVYLPARRLDDNLEELELLEPPTAAGQYLTYPTATAAADRIVGSGRLLGDWSVYAVTEAAAADSARDTLEDLLTRALALAGDAVTSAGYAGGIGPGSLRHRLQDLRDEAGRAGSTGPARPTSATASLGGLEVTVSLTRDDELDEVIASVSADPTIVYLQPIDDQAVPRQFVVRDHR